MFKLKLLSFLILSSVFCYGQQKKSSVKFDNSILHIQYVYSSDDMDFYTATDPKSNPPKDNMPIFVITTHQETDESDSKNYIEFQKNNDVKKGATILKTAVQDTTINGFRFYSMTINEIDNKTKQNKTNLYGFLFKDKKAIIFLGSDMGKREYFNALLKTFYSMKL